METQVNNVAEATTVAKTTRTISKSELTNMVNNGAKKEEISSYYGLNNAQTTKLLQSAGLKIRKFHKPSFTLVD
jgi:beta-lactam-binding protein with PASTA domain